MRINEQNLNDFQLDFVNAYESAICIQHTNPIEQFILRWGQASTQEKESVKQLFEQRVRVIRQDGSYFNFIDNWEDGMEELFDEVGLRLE